ncbi:hypothetical protein [Mycolicibacterium sp.]|uniref:hypothetical protein n=1 Tax=Mycolicibacterium sp. TaxID=2320850 RepID=UPI00344E6F43
MYAIAALMALIGQVSGTPYIPGGDTPAGTDCSGLASWVANVASGRPAFGSRFNTGNIEGALLSRGFHYGTAPNSVVIGWNGGHAAVTLPDGTPVSSGESNSGVRVGGGGAYQSQFNHHMYLPVEAETMRTDTIPQSASGADGTATATEVTVTEIANTTNTDVANTDIVNADIADIGAVHAGAGAPAVGPADAAPAADGDTSTAI